ncbi:MAG: hypothetical protein R6V01_05630 [Thermoplasmatota archaeon]
MLERKRILSMLIVAAMVVGGLPILISSDNISNTLAMKDGEEPTRGGLYQHTESFNVSFSKPTFYDDTDPHYSHDNLKNNTWDDIGFVVFFQDQHKTSKTVGSNSATVADIYQAVFVNLSGDSRTTGTTETILMEDFTATWCGYCTSIIGAMERLDHSDWWPEKYIGVEYHISGTYGNSIGSSRKNYYCSGSGIPTWVIDGEDITVGGGTDPNSTSVDNTIKSKINNRIGTSAFNITAFAGYSDSNAWVNFTFTVEDQTFDNKMVDCNIVMVQDAFPRRHGTNDDAYLGWIAQSMKSVNIFQSVVGTPPVIENVLPEDGSTIHGQQEIRFDVTDPDAADDKIVTTVKVREVGGSEWTPIKKESGKYIWKTASLTGGEYDFPDGSYEVKIEAMDYWEETAEHTFEVEVLNPDAPSLVLDNNYMQDQLDLDGVMEGTLEIRWSADDDEDGQYLSVDIFYTRPDIDWVRIAEDIDNTGSYDWDTTDPRVPDGTRYVIKVEVTDSDNMSTEKETDFGIEINNPDPPTVQIQSPVEGQELSGQPVIRWTATDDESSTMDLTIDVYITEDGGSTWDVLKTGVPSTGSLKFDSTYYEDGGEYQIRIVATDPTDLTAEDISGTFTIYNNDIPEVNILEPREEDTVSGTVTVEWSSYDQEDDDEDLTYSISYKHSSGTYWKELAANIPNTGSYELDTTELEEGDGVYTIRVILTDTRDESSPASEVYFTVYNPDAPEIISASGPTTKVEKKAKFTWYAEDDDPGETDMLKVWFFISSDGTNWDAMAEGLPNTGSYTMDVSGLDDGTYQVKMLIADCQEGEFNMTVEHLFPGLTVDNNDPPTIDIIQGPDPGAEYDESVSVEWDATDPEGDQLTYHVYFRKAGEDTWIPATGGSQLSTTVFSLDTTDLDDGQYEIKVIAEEDKKGGYKAEVLTQTFTVKHVGDITDDDDIVDDDIIDDDDDGSSDNGMAIVIIIAFIVLIMIIAIVVAGVLIMKKRQSEAQLPPPGGIPSPQTAGVGQGQLPDQGGSQLPPPPEAGAGESAQQAPPEQSPPAR